MIITTKNGQLKEKKNCDKRDTKKGRNLNSIKNTSNTKGRNDWRSSEMPDK